jgi:hypothetical protein
MTLLEKDEGTLTEKRLGKMPKYKNFYWGLTGFIFFIIGLYEYPHEQGYNTRDLFGIIGIPIYASTLLYASLLLYFFYKSSWSRILYWPIMACFCYVEIELNFGIGKMFSESEITFTGYSTLFSVYSVASSSICFGILHLISSNKKKK